MISRKQFWKSLWEGNRTGNKNAVAGQIKRGH